METATETISHYTDRVSVWDHVIHGLLPHHCHEGAGEPCPTRPASRVAAYGLSSHIVVEVIERLSDTSIAVRWQDATRCRYDDQVWISCRARLKGRCALSGLLIRRDDLIYKPRVRSTKPVNAAAMMLASAIDRMPVMAEEADAY
ncbi:DUF3331 domain-containing protein [Paraburkholderia phenazinium]|jgi:hypothetical protein|uniref:DUF3331 domain-containing protein n=1 Tax=Paraburkholderia phenazinium TaxID=60549 RepID=A0A1G7RRX7_9BURK|nr:DUF3331 domain-containing protein [Paraburkholderia phenazinium]SDG13455.1 protein of unknown function [Paraburkholderia phenazinium]